MPYIKLIRRRALAQGYKPQNIGELNYAITKIVQDYIVQCGGPRYSALNGVVGVLECAKLELYRRMVAPYEDKKIEENGDVY